jgi:hypothetical protein
VSSYYPTVFTPQIAGHRERHQYRRLGSVRFPDLRRGQFTVSAGGLVKIPDWCIRDH